MAYWAFCKICDKKFDRKTRETKICNKCWKIRKEVGHKKSKLTYGKNRKLGKLMASQIL